jgi:hypothetical protein
MEILQLIVFCSFVFNVDARGEFLMLNAIKKQFFKDFDSEVSVQVEAHLVFVPIDQQLIILDVSFSIIRILAFWID